MPQQTAREIIEQMRETRREIQNVQELSNGITERALYLSENASIFTRAEADQMAEYLEHLQLVVRENNNLLAVKIEYLSRQLTLAIEAERS